MKGLRIIIEIDELSMSRQFLSYDPTAPIKEKIEALDKQIKRTRDGIIQMLKRRPPEDSSRAQSEISVEVCDYSNVENGR